MQKRDVQRLCCKKIDYSPFRILYVCAFLISFLMLYGCDSIYAHANAHTGNTYYVSKNGNNTDGRSWATAWNELAKINWAVIQPGDTILLDGGQQSMTYNTALVIGKNGVSGAPVTIKRATEAGHRGTVVLFGGRATPLPYCGQQNYANQAASFGAGIVFGSHSWIVVDGMDWGGIRIHGFSRYGIDMSQGPAHATLRNIEIYDNGQAGQHGSGGTWGPDTNGHGVFLAGSDLTFSRMNIYDNADDAFDTGQAPGIHSVTIDYSWLHVTREDPGQAGLPFNECVHQDGYQIYDGGTQNNLLIDNSVLGPGMGTGLILGQTPGRATVNDVTVRNSLFLNKDINIMGYPQVPETGWVIDHDTIFTPGKGIPGGVYQALFLQGSRNTVTHSIFYDGQIYLPDGLVGATGNCQWQTTGSTDALGGQVVDPQFMTNVSAYDYHTPLAIIERANFAPRKGSPCAGSGSLISSVGAFLQIVTQNTMVPPTTASASGTASHTPTVSPGRTALPTRNTPTQATTGNGTGQSSTPGRFPTAADNSQVKSLWLIAGGTLFLGASVLFLLFQQRRRKKKKTGRP